MLASRVAALTVVFVAELLDSLLSLLLVASPERLPVLVEDGVVSVCSFWGVALAAGVLFDAGVVFAAGVVPAAGVVVVGEGVVSVAVPGAVLGVVDAGV